MRLHRRSQIALPDPGLQGEAQFTRTKVPCND